MHATVRCSRAFPTLNGLRIHVSRWCGDVLTQRSRRGSNADRAVKVVKKRAAQALLDQVHVGDTTLENVHSFEYLGAALQWVGSDEADVLHRMAISQTTFVSLSNICWDDHRSWTLSAAVVRSINGFNSRFLHVITGQDYRHIATALVFDLLRAIRQRRLRCFGNAHA